MTSPSLRLPLAALPAVIGPGLWSYWFVAVLTGLVLLAVDAGLGIPGRALKIEFEFIETWREMLKLKASGKARHIDDVTHSYRSQD